MLVDTDQSAALARLYLFRPLIQGFRFASPLAILVPGLGASESSATTVKSVPGCRFLETSDIELFHLQHCFCNSFCFLAVLIGD